ncbi:MAG TPA: alpha/beta hydrolase-fold protein [Pyrinomonadaceae bacterium]|nr:alpha/beta hydrolase-fold protein [Pyrinomonadaceae bacterium]
MRTLQSFARIANRYHSIGPKLSAWVLGMFALLVLTAASAVAQAPAPAGATALKINSAVLGEERTILVRVPAAYETNKARYPVIYMTDGNAHIAHTGSTVEFLARNGRMSEMIVVGIVNTDRTRDLSPTHVTTTVGGGNTALQFPTSGGADKFLKFIETELIPEIEKRYRTQPYRILAGHSLGGLFAVHAMLSRPEVFQSYIAVSPALQWDNQVVIKRAEDFFKDRKEYQATFFMTLGREPGPIEDGYHQLKQILAKNQTKGFDWEAKELDDEDHGSVVLRSHYYAMRKVYDGWRVPRDPDTGRMAGDFKFVEEHYQKLSQKFRYPVPVPEPLINQLGYQSLFAGRSDEAIAIFKTNVERYPESANVYDSLAEAYERSGKLDLAAPLYEKAKILGEQNKDPNLAIYTTNFERVSEKLKTAAAGGGGAKKN